MFEVGAVLDGVGAARSLPLKMATSKLLTTLRWCWRSPQPAFENGDFQTADDAAMVLAQPAFENGDFQTADDAANEVLSRQKAAPCRLEHPCCLVG
jgi:hypothetical protein